MGEAIECDRCGDYEPRDDEVAHPGGPPRGDLSVIDVDREEWVHVDLCEDCRVLIHDILGIEDGDDDE